MTITTLVAPAAEPLTSSDSALREHLSLTSAETWKNNVIDAYCAAARSKVETYLRKRLITQTVRLTLDGFSGAIPLPIGPIQSVAGVSYLAGDGAWQEMEAAAYRLIDSATPFELRPAYGTSWPVPRPDFATVRIDLVVGFGETASGIEPAILQAMRLLIADMDLNREATGAQELRELPLGFRQMLDPFRLWV